jgi:hypothetical protein
VHSTHRVLEHRARAIVALLALALAALALAACGGGGGGGGGSNDAKALLKQTFTGAHKVKSGKANLQLSVDAQGSSQIRGPIKLGVTGPFQSVAGSALPQFDLAINAGAQGQGIQAGLTSTGERLFVAFGGTAYEVPASLLDRLKQSLKHPGQQGSAAKGKLDLAGLGLDPLGWLKGATVTGKETLGGVETEHITAQLDVGALLGDVDKLLAKVSQQGLGATAGRQIPSSIPANVRADIESAVKNATVEVWTGAADKTLRKIALALTVEPKRGSLKRVDIAFSLELQDLNQPQTIKAPASSRPLSELLGQFQGLLGGSLGGGSSSIPGLGGGSGGGGSTSGGATKRVDDYANCLKAAGADVQKAQDCAKLLTK